MKGKIVWGWELFGISEEEGKELERMEKERLIRIGLKKGEK